MSGKGAVGWGAPARKRYYCAVADSDQLYAQRTTILDIARRHGAGNVRVFGSVARGEARPDSDIDFLVDLDPGRSLFDLGGLATDLEAFLGRSVDVVTERGLRERIRANVLRDARAL
jgi:uncharacterized protein